MTWEVRWPRTVVKELARVDPPAQRQRIITAMDQLASEGRGDVKKLRGSDDEYRLRVGSYRVRFALDRNSQTVNVLAVFHRQQGY